MDSSESKKTVKHSKKPLSFYSYGDITLAAENEHAAYMALKKTEHLHGVQAPDKQYFINKVKKV